ncbi:MAG: EutN/CcmL family microcompartment protein [Candidatus Latescibacteria bacterium]|nr:EutN/CcmL family microcompartment protein [Candidatus Latescibacterota bacterium]
MDLGRVTGTVVATQKNERLAGYKLLIVSLLTLEGKPTGAHVVALDTIGAGVGETVIVVRGSSARQAEGMGGVPVDASIIAIIDSIEVEGTIRYRKSDERWTMG